VSLCSHDSYSSCSNRFDCGDVTDMGYPFWGNGRPEGCGHPDLELNCSRNITTIEIMNVKYRVLSANYSNQILKIVREDNFLGGICPPDFVNTTVDSQFFYYGPGSVNITLLYGCPPTYFPPVMKHFPFSCTIDGIDDKGGYIVEGALGPESCAKSVVVPVLYGNDHYQPPNLSTIEEIIKRGFDVKWKEDAACTACTESKGVCGYDPSKNQPTCYCPNQSSGLTCAAGAPQAPTTTSKSGMSLIF
jgi:hypothetical protein